MSYFRSVNQAVTESSTNSSTTNLAQYLGGDATGLDTFIGTSASTLGVNAIQVGLKTDMNCNVWVEQSNDSTNWDLSDSYEYYSGVPNFGITVQAISSYVRTRVRNLGDSSTSYFRLSTVLCPIVEALPRSLSSSGLLKVAVEDLEDEYGFNVENTPMGEMRTVEPYRLAGSTFTGTLDSNYWTDSTGTGGSATVSQAQCVLSTGTTDGNDVSLRSVAVARYTGGSSCRFRSILRIPDAGVAGNVRRWGAFDGTNGAYFQLSDTTTLSVVTLKDSTASVVSSGSFNGKYGTTYKINQNVATYEIYYTNSKVWFVLGSELLHTVSATTNTWTSTMHLPIRFENNNNTGVTTNVAMNIRSGTIYRLGRESTSPKYRYVIGNGNTVTFKTGPGFLHRMVVNDGASGSSITIYDNTTGAGTILAVLTTATVSSPISIEFGVPFYTGLTVVVANTVNFTAVYE